MTNAKNFLMDIAGARVICYFVNEKVCIEDNHFVLKATKQDFEDRGIPELYYHSLLKEFEVNNRFIDSMQINHVNELFEQGKQQYQDSLD